MDDRPMKKGVDFTPILLVIVVVQYLCTMYVDVALTVHGGKLACSNQWVMYVRIRRFLYFMYNSACTDHAHTINSTSSAMSTLSTAGSIPMHVVWSIQDYVRCHMIESAT